MQVSDHAQRRYAERIMDRDTKADVAVYVSANKDKINNDINKMVEYGTLIYSGKMEKNNNIVNVYIKDTWIVLVDPGSKRVITLYSIDLGVGNLFNEEYIGRLMHKLESAKADYEAKNAELQELIQELREQQEENKEKITEYRRLANELEKANENIVNVISDYEVQRYVAEAEVRDIVETLIGKKVK